MFRFTLAAFFIVTFVGCSSAPSDAPELAPTTGIVLLDGEPLAAASVSFQPVDGRRGAAGPTDDNGRFELGYVTQAGCPIGECTVSISTRAEVLDEWGGVSGMKPETIPARYQGQNSELKATVTADGENDFTFELSSDGKIDE